MRSEFLANPIDLPVKEVARIIHRELAEKMRYARVWGKSVKIQGQQVGPEHVLEDGDVIEIYT